MVESGTLRKARLAISDSELHAILHAAGLAARTAGRPADDVHQCDLCLPTLLRNGFLAIDQLQSARAGIAPAARDGRRQPRSPVAVASDRFQLSKQDRELAALRANLRRLRLQPRHGRRRSVFAGLPGARRADSNTGPAGVRRPMSRPARREAAAGRFGGLLLPGLHDDLEYGLGLQSVHPVDQTQPTRESVRNVLLQRELQQAVPVELT